MSAGLAATGASLVTSRFGVAGTLLGAALTAMIITGGSAILRAYLESLSGRVREVPKKLRSRREQKAGGTPTAPCRDGPTSGTTSWAGCGRPSVGSRNLPTLRRRSILMKGLLAAVVAFVLCLGLVWGAEKVIGNSLSCGLWSEVPLRRDPRHSPHGLRRHGRGLLALGRRDSAGREAKPRRPRAAEREPVRGRPGPSSETPAAAPHHRPPPNPPLRRSRTGVRTAGGTGGPHLHRSPRLQQSPIQRRPAARQQAAPSSASPAAGQ